MTEREAIRVVESTASGESVYSVGEAVQALCTLALAGRIHMQQLKNALHEYPLVDKPGG